MDKSIAVIKDEWYQKLLYDLKLLAWEKRVEIKHFIGKRILEDELKFKRAEYGKKTIANLAQDLDANKRDLYRCIQFAKKFPAISELCPDGTLLSWRQIRDKYLPESIHFSSESSEWTTPQLIINKTIQLLGEIDLDPCSNPDFPNIPAKKHFKKSEGGLSKEWHGKVYMNPPYGSEIKGWIDYLYEQHKKNNVQEAIALTPSRTDTKWFQKMKIYPRCFIWGRLKFGENDNSAPFPSMAVYLGRNINDFIKIFSDIGDTYKLIK